MYINYLNSNNIYIYIYIYYLFKLNENTMILIKKNEAINRIYFFYLTHLMLYLLN